MTMTFPEGAAIVFGGSGGLGRGIATSLAQAKSNVAICYHSKKEAAEEACQEIAALGVKATAHRVDVQDIDQVQQVFDEAAAAHGRVHTVVWGAGPLVDQVPLADVTPQQWRRAIEVEVFGFFNATRAALPHFRAKGGGSFVHLGSAGDDLWPELDGLSVAPKATNDALIRGIAKEQGKHNIRANTVLVGVIEAGMFLELREQGVFDQAWTDEVQKNLCLKRWGKTEDIGTTVTFLASDAANYITGQTISVSGGYGV